MRGKHRNPEQWWNGTYTLIKEYWAMVEWCLERNTEVLRNDGMMITGENINTEQLRNGTDRLTQTYWELVEWCWQWNTEVLSWRNCTYRLTQKYWAMVEWYLQANMQAMSIGGIVLTQQHRSTEHWQGVLTGEHRSIENWWNDADRGTNKY
jgi:hypothetical protein